MCVDWPIAFVCRHDYNKWGGWVHAGGATENRMIIETAEEDWCCVHRSFPEWRSFLEPWTLFSRGYSGFFIKFTVLFNIWKEPAPGPEWIELMRIGQLYIKVIAKSNDKNPFHFNFNRITEHDVSCVLLQGGVECVGTLQCVPNVSVCCMNYQWEDGVVQLSDRDSDWDVHSRLTGLMFPSSTAKETLTVGLHKASCFHGLKRPERAPELKDW